MKRRLSWRSGSPPRRGTARPSGNHIGHGSRNPDPASNRVSIADAITAFLAIREGSRIAPSTMRKYRTFTKQLHEFGDHKGYVMLDQFTAGRAELDNGMGARQTALTCQTTRKDGTPTATVATQCGSSADCSKATGNESALGCFSGNQLAGRYGTEIAIPLCCSSHPRSASRLLEGGAAR
jgi:hypothetical protein